MDGSCECLVGAIGALSHRVSSLTAGKEYTFFVKSISEYGKESKGFVSFIQSMYTDVVTSLEFTITVDIIEMEMDFKSGVGISIELVLKATLGNIYREYSKDFRLKITDFED